jgi:GTPase SAR1 family protein
MSLWIEQIKEVDDSDITMILVGSKSDLEKERKVAYK